ncbi:hypothetical protein BLNAU_19035 [Blattamonas nauphoetae]|uniref:Uncharacterized protein n=1 Tax=Blattamonas nauphoetae TaxID=2049346 RepID=A0ABQ9X2N3_9EUKA|nr:hypothetical protein BLNAU_19035 [Blattamonas nauphoetae]
MQSSANSSPSDSLHRSTSRQIHNDPTYLQTLPPLTFTDSSHFSLNHTIITRTSPSQGDYGDSFWSSALHSDQYASGVISITITILSIPDHYCQINVGLMDSNDPIPKVDEILGSRVKNSASLDRYGYLWFTTPADHFNDYCQSVLNEGDCVRMEVDLDSTPRTLQFFVNGEAGWCYVSGIPLSVRIGSSVCVQGTSFRIDNISRLSQPTPISEEIHKTIWRAFPSLWRKMEQELCFKISAARRRTASTGSASAGRPSARVPKVSSLFPSDALGHTHGTSEAAPRSPGRSSTPEG